MTAGGPIALTGSSGRLGRAIVGALARRGMAVTTWSRPEYELDDASSADRLVSRDMPALVIHAAAWTDVDGCARQPALAHRRNGAAVGELAASAARSGARFALISTNEVFDGRRADGHGYTEADPTAPINPYGASKLAGEELARSAYEQAVDRLWVVRTAWLFGPPGNDFPTRILRRAEQLAPGEALAVVTDERGSPTFSQDVAPALLDLLAQAPGGVYHLAGAGSASRYELAQRVVERCRPATQLKQISGRDFVRASTPPAWAVLDCSRAARFGVRLRPWTAALADYLAAIC
jgi:dTDP-4-dehydrorhamnose reductase